MPASVLERTLTGLKVRSAGWRESAAIWAGQVKGETEWIAQCAYFHHELCNDQAGPLSLELSEKAKYRLYEELSHHHLRLIALIHTHPTNWVGLSAIDEQNQLCSRVGFWSIVVPFYARARTGFETMGVHVRAESGWLRLTGQETTERVTVVEDFHGSL